MSTIWEPLQDLLKENNMLSGPEQKIQRDRNKIIYIASGDDIHDFVVMKYADKDDLSSLMLDLSKDVNSLSLDKEAMNLILQRGRQAIQERFA